MHLFCLLNGGMETASARERFLRYLPELAREGIHFDVHVAGDVASGLLGRVRYWADFVRRLRRCDGVVIHRVPLSATERAVLRASGRPVLFDVDDAIWFDMTPALGGFPKPSRRARELLATMRLARVVRAGNQELADYAHRLGLKTLIAPTCVAAAGSPAPRNGPVTIGWIGHSTNLPYLTSCLPAIRRLAGRARLRVVADRPLGVPDAEFEPWSLECEPEMLRSFDIGIMPLADTPWTRGKCGYKLLLYMAHGIPVVASPVGVNTELVEEGRNGFLARTDEDWHRHLSALVEKPELRASLGEGGRAFVAGRYDHEAGLRALARDLRETFRPRAAPRKRVTMLLFHHPPLGGSASVRNSTMARHLRDPIVVSIARWPTYFRDASIAGVADVRRVNAPDLGALMRGAAFPDRALVWAALALPEALRAARQSAAIFSTSPPESTHLLAWMVKRITGLPWIADFSNEWTDNPARTDSRVRLALHRRLERFVMASADRITTLSPHHTRLLKATYPRPERIETLWTGWDPAEAKPPELRPRGERAVVLFAGMFYGIQRPDPFLDLAERVGGVEFHVLGDAWDSSARLSRSTIPVRLLGRVPRAEALARMRDADFLLITLTERASGVVPGKMFEYAAAGRPILPVVPPDGEVARWVRETRTGFVVVSAPELADLLARWRAGSLDFRPDAAALARYSAAVVAEQLDRIVRGT